MKYKNWRNVNLKTFKSKNIFASNFKESIDILTYDQWLILNDTTNNKILVRLSVSPDSLVDVFYFEDANAVRIESLNLDKAIKLLFSLYVDLDEDFENVETANINFHNPGFNQYNVQ